MYSYTKGVTLGPAMTLRWLNGTGQVRDLSTGHTFVANITAHNTPEELLTVKSTGITGYANDALGYNLLIDWATDDHADLPATIIGVRYDVHVIATPSGGDPFEFARGQAWFTLFLAPGAVDLPPDEGGIIDGGTP